MHRSFWCDGVTSSACLRCSFLSTCMHTRVHVYISITYSEQVFQLPTIVSLLVCCLLEQCVWHLACASLLSVVIETAQKEASRVGQCHALSNPTPWQTCDTCKSQLTAPCSHVGYENFLTSPLPLFFFLSLSSVQVLIRTLHEILRQWLTDCPINA